MKRIVKYFIVLSSFFLFANVGYAQSTKRKELEKKREQLQEEIKTIQNLFFKTQKEGKSLLVKVNDHQQKIQRRNYLIQTIEEEIEELSLEIDSYQVVVDTLENKLLKLKKEYADMVYQSYKSKSQNSRLMFILSSEDFYQAYKRLQYMKQYSQFRKKQGEVIVIQKLEIQKFTDSLLNRKKLKESLIEEQVGEQSLIAQEKENLEKIIKQIKKKESKYKRDIKKKIAAEAKIDKQIDKLIKDEIARANKKAKEEAAKKLAAASKKPVKKPKTTEKPNNNKFILTKESKFLAVKFESNKGKLPWPVERGLVVRKFGPQPHPTFKGITIVGTGIHIATEKGAKARCVFDGEVFAIQVLKEGKKAVYIRHGNYITIYNNLENVSVAKGDIVETKQEIGTIFTDKVTDKTILSFVLSKDTKRLDPIKWIHKI
ncbi:murein hydrolase activator EnvC family protein [Aureivirga sp. CE67]|uniref:murein hydrolase activator EnvC family protein n=1 Tax=Aureivirga sp. CE67 TaxID=1788983 RepID=UPI0018C96F11|nr:peptidoglycan DD-metalloendopeptidase family protein [Aureivirga sp. CE67]